MGDNIACQRLECYYRSFCQDHLIHLKERPLIRKGRIANFQNSQKIPGRIKIFYIKNVTRIKINAIIQN